MTKQIHKGEAMITRIISGIVGFFVLLPLIIAGGIWLQIGLAVVIIIGLREFYRAFGNIKAVHYLGFIAALLHIIFIGGEGFTQNPHLPLLVVPIMLAVLSMVFIVIRHKTHNITDAAITVFGYFYIAITLSTIYLMRDLAGVFPVWLVFISAWGCDTGAYFAGRFFGRHKLAPTLSPNKTIEGSVGGTVLATFLGAAYGFVLHNLGHLDFWYILVFALVAFVCSIAGQIGDLSASSIKRHTGIKDFGNVMPGHGGVLDRFDSIIFTAPLAFIIYFALLFLQERF